MALFMHPEFLRVEHQASYEKLDFELCCRVWWVSQGLVQPLHLHVCPKLVGQHFGGNGWRRGEGGTRGHGTHQPPG